jgi:ferrous iron transport protein A
MAKRGLIATPIRLFNTQGKTKSVLCVTASCAVGAACLGGEAHFGTPGHRAFPDVRTSQTAVTLVVASGRKRVRMELELKMIFNFIFGRHKKGHHRKRNALADLRVGESAILSELELSPPVAEHLMNLGFVPGLEVTVARSGPGGDPRVYRVEGTEIAMRRDVSRRIHVELLGAPAFGD